MIHDSVDSFSVLFKVAVSDGLHRVSFKTHCRVVCIVREVMDTLKCYIVLQVTIMLMLTLLTQCFLTAFLVLYECGMFYFVLQSNLDSALA